MKNILTILSSTLIGTSTIANLNTNNKTNLNENIIKPIFKENWTDKNDENSNLYQTTEKMFYSKIIVSYKNYSDLNTFLKSNDAFNLGAKFESRIGVIGKWKTYNDTFNKNNNVNILNKYISDSTALTSISWTRSDGEITKAEIDLLVSNDDKNKLLYFNFKSILSNWNMVDTIYNYMY